MEREVGGGIRMGNTCKSMADSFQCMTKSTTIKKKNGSTEFHSINAPQFILDNPQLIGVDGCLD